jgi:hypothetical protein
MTWRFKVQGVLIAILVLAALAMAVGAQYVDSVDGSWASWGW